MPDTVMTLFDQPAQAPLPAVLVVAPDTPGDHAGRRLVEYATRDLVSVITADTDEAGVRHPARVLRAASHASLRELKKHTYEADGVIVLASPGPIPAVLWLLERIASLGIPALVLYDSSDRVDARVREIASQHGMVIASFTPDSIVREARAWLATYRLRIFDGPRRRGNREISFAQVYARIAASWTALDGGQRLRVLLSAGMLPERLQALIDGPDELACTSVRELQALAAALDVDLLGAFAEQLPLLHADQRSALAVARDEDGWDDEEAAELELAARLELARGGVRRLRFAQPDDWRALRDRRHGR